MTEKIEHMTKHNKTTEDIFAVFDFEKRAKQSEERIIAIETRLIEIENLLTSDGAELSETSKKTKQISLKTERTRLINACTDEKILLEHLKRACKPSN